MKLRNLKMVIYGGLIVTLVSLLSIESFAAKKKSKNPKSSVTVAQKTKSKVKKKNTDASVATSEKIKVIKRKPASVEAPPGVPTELPEKMIFVPAEDSASNSLIVD